MKNLTYVRHFPVAKKVNLHSQPRKGYSSSSYLKTWKPRAATAVITYIFLIAVLNLALGFAVAVYLGRRYGRLGAFAAHRKADGGVGFISPNPPGKTVKTGGGQDAGTPEGEPPHDAGPATDSLDPDDEFSSDLDALFT